MAGFCGSSAQKKILHWCSALPTAVLPIRFLAAYTEFWWKAADDYGNAFATATKLMTGVTTKMVMAAQSATEEAGSRNVFGTREAA